MISWRAVVAVGSTSRRRLTGLEGGRRCHFSRQSYGGGGRFVGVCGGGSGGGDTLATGTHGECGGGEWLARVRGNDSGWTHFHCSEFFNFPCESSVLFSE